MSDEEPAKAGDNLPAKNPGGKGTRHRHPAISEESRAILLERIAEGHTLKDAVAAAGISNRRRVLELREADPEFAAAYEDAWSNGNDALVEEARRRAVEGWDEPIASAGKIVGTKRMYDSRLLERLLAARIPAFRNQPTTTLTVNAGADGMSVKAVQHGVTTEEVVALMLESGALTEDKIHRLGLQRSPEAEVPADTAEVVDEVDEPLP